MLGRLSLVIKLRMRKNPKTLLELYLKRNQLSEKSEKDSRVAISKI
jgi:hypothetical protein